MRLLRPPQLASAATCWNPVAQFVEQRTAATLPHCWRLGALLVMLYRVAAMPVTRPSWGEAETESNRRIFLRLSWRTISLGAFEVGALYLNRSTTGVY